jgi:microcystin-dependent protein
MTIQIKHPFVSLKGDGGDATLVRPSNWNAVHTTSMASGSIIGRLTAGAGAFEEIPISAYMANLLASADANALAGALGLFTTGDVKYSFAGGTPAGWLVMSNVTNLQTIGSAASGATLRANADTQALYVMLYTNLSDALAPVSGGRSGNAVNDFNANKTLSIPQLAGKSPMGAGAAGGGLSARANGTTYGEENHTLTVNELATHYHTAAIYDPTHTHSHNCYGVASSSTGGGAFGVPTAGTPTINANATGVRINSSNGLDTTYSNGGNAAHNTIHPVIALNVWVKL